MMVVMQRYFIHMGYQAENDSSILEKKPSSVEEETILKTLKQILKEDNQRWHRAVSELQGFQKKQQPEFIAYIK